MNSYKALNKQIFSSGGYTLLPIRMEDRFAIMKWRNEQMYHLRQNKPLTEKDQEEYFRSVVSSLFDQERPNQLLFSFTKDKKLIGYGGLVHINWVDKNAEISFIMETSQETLLFEINWSIFLDLIQEVGFGELKFHKVFTYAFDVRPKLYPVLEVAGFQLEADLKEHCFFDGKFISVKIHSKIL